MVIFPSVGISPIAEVGKIKFLLYLVDYVGTLFAFILVFFGLWILLLTNPVTGAILLVLGIGLGVGSFAIGKKLKDKPAAGSKRL